MLPLLTQKNAFGAPCCPSQKVNTVLAKAYFSRNWHRVGRQAAVIEPGRRLPFLETTAISGIMPGLKETRARGRTLRFWPGVVSMANTWLYDRPTARIPA
jgi:hypothetical protein